MANPTNVVRKNMRLNQDLIDRVRRILGTRTESAAVEQALEMEAARDEVLEGISTMAGTDAVEDPP